MKGYIAEGRTIDHAPAAQRLSGAGTLIGAVGNGIVGVAKDDVGASATGVFYIAGVFELPKLGTDVVAQGALLYWDNTNLRLTTSAAGNTIAGRAYAAAGNGVATAQIILNAS